MARKKPLTRRQFLATGSLSVAAASGLTGCGSSEDGSEPAPSAASKVAVVHRDDVAQAVRRAVEISGGLEAIQPGDSVFIKPNVVHNVVLGQPGIITSFEVLGALIALVKERGAGHVTVGDRSARFVPGSEYVFNQIGIIDAMLAAGADEVYPAPTPTEKPEDWVKVQPPHWDETWSADGGILAMRRILEADHFINAPVCKNHRWAGFSLSMKNLIGAVGDQSRDPMHYNEGDPDRLSRDIAILNLIYQPILNVIDAQLALINGGPEGVVGDQVFTQPGLILAGRDRVALDAAGASLIKLELGRTQVPTPDELHAFTTALVSPWDFPQVKHGAELGLGVGDPANVELIFDEVADEQALRALYDTPAA